MPRWKAHWPAKGSRTDPQRRRVSSRERRNPIRVTAWAREAVRSIEFRGEKGEGGRDARQYESRWCRGLAGRDPQEGQKNGQKIRGMPRSSVLDCSQSFASVVRALVESLLRCSPKSTADEGGVRVLFDCSRLCCRLDSEGFGVSPEMFMSDECLEVLTNFATVSLVTRPSGSIETREILWKGKEIVSDGHSKHVFHSYGSRIILRDLLVNIPVRRKLLLDTTKEKHLVLLRSLLFPVMVSNSNISFQFLSATDSLSCFGAKPNTSVPQALVDTFGLEPKNLVQINIDAGQTNVTLHYMKDWILHHRVSFEHFFLNGKEFACESVARDLRLAAWNLSREDPDTTANQKRRNSVPFSFVLQVNCSKMGNFVPTSRDKKIELQVSEEVNEALDRMLQSFVSAERDTMCNRYTKVSVGKKARKWVSAHQALEKDAPTHPSGFPRKESHCQCFCHNFGFKITRDANDPVYNKKGCIDCGVQKRERNADFSEVKKIFGMDVLPGNVSREMLSSSLCIGQVDTKFIASVCGRTLILFDQHAADERIRLESFTLTTILNLKNGNDSIKCEPPLSFHPALDEIQTLQEYKERMEEWGWKATFQKSRNLVLVYSVPCIKGRKLTLSDFREYVHQLQQTGGAKAMPQAINYVLGSKACRSAIKFGDSLGMSECKSIIKGITKAKMPFQCAHGRPTCAPLIDLHKLERAEATLQNARKRRFSLTKLKQRVAALEKTSMDWHRDYKRFYPKITMMFLSLPPPLLLSLSVTCTRYRAGTPAMRGR